MAVRNLAPEPFHVEPHFIGQPLASPGRRLAAFFVDCLLIVVPTLVGAVLAAGFSLYLADRSGFEAALNIGRLDEKERGVARTEARALAPLLVRLEAPGVPPELTEAVERGELDRAADILLEYNLVITIKVDEGPQPKMPAKSIRFPVEELVPGPIRAIALFGVPALYFAAFTRSKRGATLGKRLLGIRVVRLDGERLSWLEAIERFVGYVHIPATAFVGVLDLWRDQNRRLPHDRTVHTAVFRVARQRATRSLKASAKHSR